MFNTFILHIFHEYFAIYLNMKYSVYTSLLFLDHGMYIITTSLLTIVCYAWQHHALLTLLIWLLIWQNLHKPVHFAHNVVHFTHILYFPLYITCSYCRLLPLIITLHVATWNLLILICIFQIYMANSSEKKWRGGPLFDPASHYYLKNLDYSTFVINNVSQGSANYYPWHREMTKTLLTKRKLGFVLGTLSKRLESNVAECEAWITCHGVIR